MKTWTILICCYNCTKTIERALETIVFKNNDDIDVFLVDDGSTDNLYKVIKPYVNAYPDQIHYFKKQNGNQGSCINFALKKAQSRFFSLLDSDDEYNINDFQKVINTLRKIRKNTDLVLLNYDLLFHKKNKIKHKRAIISLSTKKKKYTTFNKMTLSPIFTIHNSIYSLSMLKQIKPLPEHTSFSDIALYHQILLRIKNIVYLNKKIHLYQYHIYKDKQIIYIKNSIKKFPDFLKVFEYLLNIPIKQSSKKRILAAKKNICYLLYWIMEVLAQNYNFTKKQKSLIIKECYRKIKIFEIENNCLGKITPVIFKLFHKSKYNGIFFAKFIYSIATSNFIQATKWTKKQKKHAYQLLKKMKLQDKLIQKHDKLFKNSSNITNI